MSLPQPATAGPALRSAPEIDLRSVLRRRADVRFRVLDGEAVVVLQEAAEVLVLNETASRLLELADGATPLAAIAKALEAEYDVMPEVLGADLVAGARELAAAGLLEVAGGGRA
jgi:hypothetical protein